MMLLAKFQLGKDQVGALGGCMVPGTFSPPQLPTPVPIPNLTQGLGSETKRELPQRWGCRNRYVPGPEHKAGKLSRASTGLLPASGRGEALLGAQQGRWSSSRSAGRTKAGSQLCVCLLYHQVARNDDATYQDPPSIPLHPLFLSGTFHPQGVQGWW